MKRFALVLSIAAVLVFAMTGLAFANFGPHGGYTQDTDACAGCHRAHTSFSSITWVGRDNVGGRSALLVSDATNMTDFCYACHGDGAPGASTNVQMGIFDTGPTAVTNSSFNATLNAGGFEMLGAAAPVMSAHDMRAANQGPLVPWGFRDPTSGASNLTVLPQFTCTSCHDPHGSSNYRLLKDQVNGIAVGGYNAGGAPTPYVISNEAGYPSGGFKKGADGVADVAAYVPNYTAPQYAKGNAATNGKAMSAWCSGCHTAYSEAAATAYDYGAYESVRDTDTAAFVGTVGNRVRYRHQVDIPLLMGQGPGRALNVELIDDSGLPLEMGIGLLAGGATHTSAKIWDETGNISCLTCHFAHGSDATMAGFAVAELTTSAVGAVPVTVTPGVTTSLANQGNPLGVNPNFSGAMLRYDNRGVCERCHNK